MSPTSSKRKRRKRKSEEERRRKEKESFALLVFIMATLEIVFGPNKAVSPEGLPGGNVFKNPTRHTPLAHLP